MLTDVDLCRCLFFSRFPFTVLFTAGKKLRVSRRMYCLSAVRGTNRPTVESFIRFSALDLVFSPEEA